MRLVFSVLCAAFSLVLPVSALADGATVGKSAPDFRAPLASGGTLALSSLRGKPVYLNFFATWCPPCNEEAPDVNALQKQYRKRGLVVLGVDWKENADHARSFVKKYGLSYRAVVDQSGDLLTPYGSIGLPVHVFIDRRGNVKLLRQGEMDKQAIDAAIRSIL